MELKDSMSLQKGSDIPVYNPYNYSFIFKKTEKIAYSVFYLTAASQEQINGHDVVSYVRDTAQHALDAVLDFLTLKDGQNSRLAVQGLLRLESAIQLGVASGVFEPAHADILTREIEDVLRNMYTLENADTRAEGMVFDQQKVFAQAIREQKLREQQHRPSRASLRDHSAGMTQGSSVRPAAKDAGAAMSRTLVAKDRRSAIRDVLSSKGQANIKDIADVVTDCSEKTIQRELIAMIKDGEVVREGERRWSVYKLKQ